jgi:CubicO group peptidase (beta-lactamase class C family)
MSVRDLARIGVVMLRGGKVGDLTIVPSDWVTRRVAPVISADEVRRYGYQWFITDIALGKPKGWAARRLERMWWAQGEGGQRLSVIPALQRVVAPTFGLYGIEDQGLPPASRFARGDPG